ncbi:MAG: 50S ribosomal protein L11 methyltransferase [Deltaproteobacteria bacterium]|nr:50S ribosomal protein L11 methyltransferase [Deltaproteobacteria bacterium]
MTTTWALRIDLPPGDRDWLVAEFWSLGTLGLEETDDGLVAYFAGDDPPAAALEVAERIAGVRAHPAERVPARDWETEWRRGLAPRRVGPLWIRPSWCESQGRPELVIDPQQAFGSGEHATTRLSLALLLDGFAPGERVLDVGTGSGILLLGALRLGANGVGLDVDPVACRNAASNARANGLPARFFCGTLDALAPGARFDRVVANMLLGRLEPLLERLRAHAGGLLVLSGYLESEAPRVHAAMQAPRWTLTRELREAQSGDVWCASVWSPPSGA